MAITTETRTIAACDVCETATEIEKPDKLPKKAVFNVPLRPGHIDTPWIRYTAEYRDPKDPLGNAKYVCPQCALEVIQQAKGAKDGA